MRADNPTASITEQAWVLSEQWKAMSEEDKDRYRFAASALACTRAKFPSITNGFLSMASSPGVRDRGIHASQHHNSLPAPAYSFSTACISVFAACWTARKGWTDGPKDAETGVRPEQGHEAHPSPPVCRRMAGGTCTRPEAHSLFPAPTLQPCRPPTRSPIPETPREVTPADGASPSSRPTREISPNVAGPPGGEGQEGRGVAIVKRGIAVMGPTRRDAVFFAVGAAAAAALVVALRR